MLQIKKLILDILKPHKPGVLEFASAVAAQGHDYRVSLKVLEMDENTETLEVTIEGQDIELETISRVIKEMGASLHSIDGVDVVNTSDNTE